ncbi:MAG: ribonuclease HII, partial [Nitrospinota bacterium]
EQLWAAGYRVVAGVDEAGMGPLAGPVVAAAVVFSPGTSIAGIADSKLLSPAQREALAREIRDRALGIGIGLVEAEEIDRINIYQAGRKAMQLAIRSLPAPPDYLLIDGRSPLPLPFPQQALVRGEQESFSIAAASIVAKVHRDQIMLAFHKRYPQYGFARHKGYGTPEHLAALRTHGPCPIHRRSYRQVRELAEGGEWIRTSG